MVTKWSELRSTALAVIVSFGNGLPDLCRSDKASPDDDLAAADGSIMLEDLRSIRGDASGADVAFAALLFALSRSTDCNGFDVDDAPRQRHLHRLGPGEPQYF